MRADRVAFTGVADRGRSGPVVCSLARRVRCRDRGASQRERMLCERLRVGAGAYLCQNPTSHFLGYTSLSSGRRRRRRYLVVRSARSLVARLPVSAIGR